LSNRIQGQMKINILFFLASALLYSEEYPYRDIHTPPFVLDQGVRIVVSSPPRTGSTLVYNILQYLFEDRSCVFSDVGKRVQKMHTLRPLFKEDLKHVHLFCTMRNPLTQFSSLLRLGKTSETRSCFKRCLKENFHFFRHSRRFPHFSFLVYETFEENFSPIFAAIEREFSIQIGKEERMRIEKHFSKESLSAIADSMETFEESDPITGIHGMHIASCTSLKKQKEFERLSKPLIHALDRIKSIPDDL